MMSPLGYLFSSLHYSVYPPWGAAPLGGEGAPTSAGLSSSKCGPHHTASPGSQPPPSQCPGAQAGRPGPRWWAWLSQGCQVDRPRTRSERGLPRGGGWPEWTAKRRQDLPQLDGFLPRSSGDGKAPGSWQSQSGGGGLSSKGQLDVRAWGPDPLGGAAAPFHVTSGTRGPGVSRDRAECHWG